MSGSGPGKQPDSTDRWGDLTETAAGSSDVDRVSAAIAELYGMAPEDFTGRRGELVKVRAGYGRNFLLPRGLAIQATPANIRQIELQRKALLKRETAEREVAVQQANNNLDVVRHDGDDPQPDHARRD